jgi:hypothetical protein
LIPYAEVIASGCNADGRLEVFYTIADGTLCTDGSNRPEVHGPMQPFFLIRQKQYLLLKMLMAGWRYFLLLTIISCTTSGRQRQQRLG